MDRRDSQGLWGSDEDVAEDLRVLRVDPSERVERYRELFEEYYRKSVKLKEGNTRQAEEKL